MAVIYSYNDLKTLLDNTINENINVNASSINSIIAKVLLSIVFKNIVDDDAALTNIKVDNRYGGLLVYVKDGNKLKMLNHDLTTWREITLEGYTQAQINTLLNDKVDKVTGKGLSENDFTTALLNKLASIEEEATKNETDNVLKERSNHTGFDQIEEVENLREELDLLWFKKRLILTSGVQLNFTYKTVFIKATGSDIEVILPDTVEDNSENTILLLKRIDNTGFNVTVLPFDYNESTSSSESVNTQLIEGFNSLSLNPKDSYMLNSIGDKWYIIAKYSA